jgi:transcriptional repressor NrdR
VQCPNCGGDTTVSETRPARHALRRRRVCTSCKQRFTTLEQVAPPPIKVDKRRGTQEPYDRAKLRRSLARVARHRPLDDDALDGLVDRIESELTRASVRHVGWGRLVELVLDALHNADRVAEARMAANYLDDTGALRLADAVAPTDDRPQLGLFSEDE